MSQKLPPGKKQCTISAEETKWPLLQQHWAGPERQGGKRKKHIHTCTWLQRWTKAGEGRGGEHRPIGEQEQSSPAVSGYWLRDRGRRISWPANDQQPWCGWDAEQPSPYLYNCKKTEKKSLNNKKIKVQIKGCNEYDQIITQRAPGGLCISGIMHRGGILAQKWPFHY